MLDNVKVEKFITAAMKYKGDKYSQPKRMEKGYSDCSSLIYKALRDSKLLDSSKTTRTISTKFMRDGDPRFKQIPKSQLKRGDILWGQDNTVVYGGHVAIYLGDGKTLEARVREGVDYNKDRPYFTRVYRIKALEETKVSKPNVTAKNLKGEVTAIRLNVRDHDSINGSVIGTLNKGAEVDITGQTQTKWYEIDYKGKKAYVSNSYVKVVKNAIENVDILINGKLIKKGYIVDGVTFATINGQDLPVRQLFENMGAKVVWQNNRVEITL